MEKQNPPFSLLDMTEAFETNWMSTVDANINEVERLAVEKIGYKYAVALFSGTASLHLSVKLAGERLYGQPELGKGALFGKRVFCSDMTFDATVNPICVREWDTCVHRHRIRFLEYGFIGFGESI